MYTKLQKKCTNNEKTLLWTVKVDGSTTIYEWGQENGKQQTKIDSYEAGKQNRSADEQALFEATSNIRKKIRLGYEIMETTLCNQMNISEKANNDLINPVLLSARIQIGPNMNENQPKYISPKPMLAHEFNHYKAYILSSNPQVFMQPKLDGKRCLANPTTGQLFSRGRLPILLKHIQDAVIALGKILTDKMSMSTDSLWFDGEIYNKNMGFQTIMSKSSKVKSKKQQMKRKLIEQDSTSNDQQIDQKIDLDELKLQYHIYDIVADVPFRERNNMLQRLFHHLSNSTENSSVGSIVQMVPTIYVHTDKILSQHQTYVLDGNEGSIIRQDSDTPYERDKRSSSLLKLKDFIQEEYPVIGFNRCKHKDTLGSVLHRTSDGHLFSSTPKMSVSEKEYIWKHPDEFIGKTMATVKFFEFTDGKVPRFPVLKGFRPVDDM